MDTIQIKTSRSYIGSEPKDLIFRPVYLNDLKLREVEAILYKIRCIIIDSYHPNAQINAREFIEKSMYPDCTTIESEIQHNAFIRLYYYDVLVAGLGLDVISAGDLYNHINVIRLHYDRTAFMHDYEIDNCKGYTVNGKGVL